MKFSTLFLIAMLLVGCVSNSPDSVQVEGRTGHIRQGSTALMRVGMTKEELISKVGLPATVSADKDKEILYYVEEMPWWNWRRVRVLVINGKVTEYGQVY